MGILRPTPIRSSKDIIDIGVIEYYSSDFVRNCFDPFNILPDLISLLCQA